MDKKNIESIYELSPMQQGMLFHSLYSDEADPYISQYMARIQGNPDVAHFQRAWQQVVERHTALRTAFHWEDIARPVQIVYRKVKVQLYQHDWRDLSPDSRQPRLRALVDADRQRGTILSTAPAMRLTLIRMEDNVYEFVWSFHHIILDGWSVQLLLQELFEFYKSFSRGKAIKLKRARPYQDYINWLQKQDLSKAEAFWRRTLGGFTELTPVDLQREHGDSPAADAPRESQEVQLSEAATSALNLLARRYKITLSTVIQTAWALLLSRYSGHKDIVFGAVVSGRAPDLEQIESMIG
ncbi:MAG TPA: condensation domain-containing protein, partial [Blastocatellia bacterium]|nr:condensation domain-containing protein [Blastocatellia bacterium]